WESQRAAAAAAAAGQTPPDTSLPVAFTVFPGEIYRAPRSWAERVYPNLSYFNEVDRGGHFASWEEPELFTEEIRGAFRSLRWLGAASERGRNADGSLNEVNRHGADPRVHLRRLRRGA